ncbi:hypothetical protein MRY87_03390 [bacterium]|nr:hypothetical protein [bacterium]
MDSKHLTITIIGCFLVAPAVIWLMRRIGTEWKGPEWLFPKVTEKVRQERLALQQRGTFHRWDTRIAVELLNPSVYGYLKAPTTLYISIGDYTLEYHLLRLFQQIFQRTNSLGEFGERFGLLCNEPDRVAQIFPPELQKKILAYPRFSYRTGSPAGLFGADVVTPGDSERFIRKAYQCRFRAEHKDPEEIAQVEAICAEIRENIARSEPLPSEETESHRYRAGYFFMGNPLDTVFKSGIVMALLLYEAFWLWSLSVVLNS